MFMLNERLEEKILSGRDFIKVYEDPNSSPVVSFVNPYSYKVLSELQSNAVLDQVDFWFSDGALLCGLIGFRRKAEVFRASFDFSSVANDVFARCVQEKSRVVLVGGAPGEVDVALDNISAMFPGIDFVYTSHGYIKSEQRLDVLNSIRDSDPDVVVVGMGTPSQELFALECRSALNKPARIFTCGGFITQTAAKPDYYHPFIKKTGLRWLQRAIEFPHVRKRLFKDYPIFVLGYLADIFLEKLRF